MLKATLSNLRAHKWRLLLTGLAVMLGVAFMSGSFVLGDTIRSTFDDLFEDANAGTDAVVRSSEVVSAAFAGDQRGQLDASVLDDVLAVDGVEDAVGAVVGFAQYVDDEGEPVGDPGQGAPTFGFNWTDNTDLNPYILVDDGVSRGPSAPDEVVVDKSTADAQDFAVGEQVTILTQQGSVVQMVVGLATFGVEDASLGASAAFFATETAQTLVGTPGKFETVSVVGDDDLDQRELAARIAVALPADTEVLTGAEFIEQSQDQVGQALQFISIFFLVFVAISLFVGTFVIYNSFSIIIAQRTRETALLRAIGASQGQVIWSVLLEAVLLGIVAGAVGLVAGIGVAIGLQALLSAFGLDIPASGLSIKPRTVVWSIIVGVVVTSVSAVIPAWRASRIPPLAAIRNVAQDSSGRSVVRAAIGAAVLTLGIVAILGGLFGDDDTVNPLILVGIGVLVTYIALFVLGPLIARPVSRFIGAPLPALRGVAGTLARENASRNPKRTAATAAALMVGVSLVAFITIFASSTKASIEEAVDEAFQGDFLIDSGAFGFGGLSPVLATELNALDEVEAAAGIRFGVAELDGSETFLFGGDAAGLNEILDVGPTDGSLDLAVDEIAVRRDLAEDRGYQIGQAIPVRFVDSDTNALTIAAIYTDDANFLGNYFLGLEAYEANYLENFDTQVIIDIDNDVDVDQARAAVELVADQYPNGTVLDQIDIKEQQAGQIDPILNIIFALLGLAILIALLGITNTLALSIFERSRELGLLRAVGMTRRQLRSTIRWESVITALLGTALGIVVGLFFGWVLVRALDSQGLTVFRIPWTALIVITVLSAIIGVLAAIGPARRASKLVILDAIAM